MKGKQYSEKQIIGILKDHEASMAVQDVIHRHGIANGTFYRWMPKCDSIEVSEAKRLRELEEENAKLKRLLAETLLEDVLGKKS